MDSNKPRILVVDDQMQNRLLVVEYLEMIDVVVDEASSGRECLDKLKEQDYLLVILDVQMPVMDGFRVLEIMQQDKRMAEIPVVFVSAVFDSEEYILKGIEKGAIDYITKPINPEILKTKVQNFIKLYDKQQTLDQLVRSLESFNKRLQYSERKLKKITQSASDAIILLDKDFKVKFWNRASNQIFGYSRFEVLYEDFFDYTIADNSKTNLIEYINTIMKGNGKQQPGTIRLAAKSKHREEFPIELSLASFTEISGEINYTVVIRDITRRVHMEKEALKAKELRESNRVMKEFMDSVSHELRTPMNAILGISNMLTKYDADNLTPKQREGLEIISQSGSRLLELINDILDLSRIDANRINLSNDKIELEKFLATMRSLVLSLVNNKSIKFHIRKSISLPEIIYSDQKKISQILTNLLGNAVKFTREGKITLYLHFVDDRLYFEVSDSGIGIEEKYLESIFERFQQIDSSETKEFEGTGLGLNICKKLITLMGGEIRAESEVGKGTIMKFYLPLEKTEGTATRDESMVEPKNEVTSGITEDIDANALLAIIIYDNSEHQFWYANLLKTKGIQSLPFASSTEALQALHRYSPDLLLLKIEMPKVHGAPIITEISKDSNLKNIPIIAISQVEDFSIGELSENLVLLKEPTDEEMIQTALAKLSLKYRKQFQHNLILFEKKNRLKELVSEEDEVFFNASSDESWLILARKKIKNLILDGMDIDGENFKLIKWLITHNKYIPENIFITVINRPFDIVADELKKLSNCLVIGIQGIKKAGSLKAAIRNPVEISLTGLVTDNLYPDENE